MRKHIFLYIHQCALRGGVEKVFYNLLNNLSADKYEITVLSYIAYLKDDLDVSLYPSNVKRYWLYYDEFSPRSIKRFFQRVHNHIFPRLFQFYLRFKKFDTAIAAQEGMYADYVNRHVHADRKLLWIHNDMSICHWTEPFFGSNAREAACYKDFDRVICVSKDVEKSMIQVFGSMDNLTVCYNPIDTNEIDQKMNTCTIQRPPCPLFVAVGRLVKQKGFDRLLRICKRLRDEGFLFCVWILGEGEERPELEKFIRENRLEQVKLLGNQSNPYLYMRTADWVICTSRHEGFNMVLHEAVWCETPIITTENAGAYELLGNSEYGIITENSEEAFYAAMKSALTHPDIQAYYQDTVKSRKSFVDLQARMDAIEELL